MEKDNKSQKSDYKIPEINRIELDNEISLQLESTPPPAPGETSQAAPEYFTNDPYKSNQM